MDVPVSHHVAIVNLLQATDQPYRRASRNRGPPMADMDSTWTGEVKEITGIKIDSGLLYYDVRWNRGGKSFVRASIARGKSAFQEPLRALWMRLLGL